MPGPFEYFIWLSCTLLEIAVVVCALKKGAVEIPSDFAGVVWEPMDEGGGWKQKLARELQAAGHVIDWNSVMR